MSQLSNGMIGTSKSTCNAFPNKKVLSNSSLEILNWMMHMKYVRREFDQCRKLAEEELIRSNGYSEYANYILGCIYQEEGEIQKSLSCFKKCNVLNPQNVENVKRIGRCLLLLGRYELALETFFKAEKLAEIPDWNIYYHLGICYIKCKNESKAKEYLKRATELGRSEKSFLELAKLYENQKDYASAISTYETALQLYPAITDLSVSLGLIFMKVEEYKKAFNRLGNAIAHDGANSDALFTFAAEIQRHGEYDVAVLKYKIAAQKLPECAEMWNNIGMCFFGKRKYVAAITCLKRSFYLSPTNWLTSFNLGLLHLNTRQYASAALFLSTAIKFNPQHGPTFTLMALSLKHLGDDSNCQRCFEEALKRNGNDVEACINYALFLFLTNKTTIAAKYYSHFQQLLNTVPNIDKELISMGSSLSHALKETEPVEVDTKNLKIEEIEKSGKNVQKSVEETEEQENVDKFAENELDTNDLV